MQSPPRDNLPSRFETEGRVPDLDVVIEAGQSLLSVLPASHKDRPQHLNLLAALKASRYEVKQIQADLDDAIDLGRQARSMLSTGDPRWFPTVNDLGCNLSARYLKTEQVADLDEAIGCARQTLQGTAPGSYPHRMSSLNLSARLMLRSQKTGDVATRDEAIVVSRRLLDDSVPGTAEHGGALSNLGVMLGERFEQTGFWRDSEEAIRLQKLALPVSREFGPRLVGNLASLLTRKYERTKDLSDLREAIQFSRESVLAAPISHSMHSVRGDHLRYHMQSLGELARATTEISEVKETISQAEELMAFMPQVHISHLYLYGDLLSRRYELSGQPWDLVQLVRVALTAAGAANAHCSERDGTGEPTKIDTNTLLVLFAHVSELATKPQDHSLVAQVSLGMHREYRRLAQTNRFIDALIAIEKDGKINVEIIIISTRDRSQDDMTKDMDEQRQLAASLGAKTYQYRIKMPEFALSTGPEGDTLRSLEELSGNIAGCQLTKDTSVSEERLLELTRLSEATYGRVIRSGKIEVLEEAIVKAESLSNLIGHGTVYRDTHLEHLSNLLVQCYSRTGNARHLDRACELMKEIASKGPGSTTQEASSETRVAVLCSLAQELRNRYLKSLNESDLNDAVTFASLAVIDKRSRNHVAAKMVLANALKSKYQLDGSLEHLNSAIGNVEEAMQLQSKIPFSEKKNVAPLINQFALMMRLRFQAIGELLDLDIGIQRIQSFLKDFVNSPFTFKDTETTEDIDVSLRGALVGNLGLLFYTKCERTGALEDIQHAIDYYGKALKLTGESNPNWAGTSVNLGSALLESYLHTDQATDLVEAVRYARQAVCSPSLNHGQRPTVLLDASIIMHVSYNRTKDPKELHQAAEFAEEALNQLPARHSTRSYFLYEYGRILEAQYNLAPSQLPVDKVINAYMEAYGDSACRFPTRVRAARNAARLLGKCKRWSAAYECLQSVVVHMAKACPRWLASGDRQYLLSLFHEIPADTAAAALLNSSGTDTAYEAVYSLELSRGVILGSTMDYRSEIKPLEATSTDILREWYGLCMELDAVSRDKQDDERFHRRQQVSEALTKTIEYIRQIPNFESFSPPLPLGSMRAYQLKAASPELYTVYNNLQRELDSFPVEKEAGRKTKRQRELSNTLDELLVRIRKLPGLEDFLLPPGRDAILELADQSRIVVLNSSSLVDQSDAIIIQQSGIEVIPLPLLRHTDIQRWMKERQDIVSGWTLRNFAEKNRRMLDFLNWLWTAAVEPTLHHLNMITEEPKEKPRVHWIGTGLLSLAPFHAAGDHADGSTANTTSHVVSSYIPTLRALSFAREGSAREHYISPKDKRLLIVAAPETPGAAALPAVASEVESLARISNSKAAVVHLKSATPTQVLQELPLANIVHLACHAISDLSDIGASHLLLNSEPGGERAEKLTVRQISAHRAPAAELAFLSACSAAENRVASLSDEAIHIASAFQLAGFRNVVGTMWQTRDRCCEEVATEFYRVLLGEHNTRTEGASISVARALHAAVEKLRMQNPSKPLAWAPFIHIGA